MDFIVFEVHIQHTEEKERGSVASDTQAANRPNEAEQTCDNVVDDEIRRNTSNMDINEQISHPNISSPTAAGSDDINRDVESERPNTWVDTNFATSKIDGANEDVETVVSDHMRRNISKTDVNDQTSHPNISSPTATESDERPNTCVDSNLTTSKIDGTNEDVETASLREAAEVAETPAQVLNGNGRLEENASVTETPVQVPNDNGRLEENVSVTETPVQVLNDNGRLEENASVTETPAHILIGNGRLEENASVIKTPAKVLNNNGRLEGNASVTETPNQVLSDNGRLEENANVTEALVQVLNDNGRFDENASVTETPALVLNGNGRLEENASVTEKGVEKRHKSSTKRSFPSPSGSGNSKNTENGLKKVVEKRSLQTSSKPEETKGRESDEDKKHLAASVLAVWSQNLSPAQEDRCIFQKPDRRSRIQKLLAQRRGEKDKKPVKRATTSEPSIISQLDARLKALDQAINRDFHDDLVMARQLTMPRLFQRSPKLQARWQVTHDMRILQEILVGIRWARERREEEKMKESEEDALKTAEAAQDEPTADDSQGQEDAKTPESSKPSPEHTSPDITIAMIHAEDPPTAVDEGSAHTGDEPGAGTLAVDVSKEEQKTVVESTSGALLRDNRQVKTAISRAESRRRLERRYTTVPFQLPPSTSGRRQQTPAQVSSSPPGRMRRTITSLSMLRGRRSSATRVSPAMMSRIQDAAKIYGGQ